MAISLRSISLALFTLITLFSITTQNPLPSAADIHDLLEQYGIPKGLLPNAVKSYTLSPTDGSFTIHLTHPCYVQFDQLVYYDKTIKGKLSYAKVSDVSGIQAKKLFFWVTVTGMNVDQDSGMIEFHDGALSQKLPISQVQTVPDCQNKSCRLSLAESI